ncbi:MAG: hypothetical protein WBN10_11375 [Polyangiales bacterium]
MARLILCWVSVCALVVALIGCSDETTATGGTGGSGDTGGDGGIGGGGEAGTGGAESVELSVTVTEAMGFSGPRPPFEGVELCETDTLNCDTTDASGVATIQVPSNQEISYTVSTEGFAPWLIEDVTDETFRATSWPMFNDMLWEDFSDALMTPYPWTDGGIFLQVHPNIEGVTFDLVNQAAKQYYEVEEGGWSLDLTSTTSRGLGGFVEVPPGEYQVEFGGTATNCTPEIAWPGDAANRIRVQVRAGHYGYGSIACDEP